MKGGKIIYAARLSLYVSKEGEQATGTIRNEGERALALRVPDDGGYASVTLRPGDQRTFPVSRAD